MANPSPGIPYFVPAALHPTGTVISTLDGTEAPPLFTPLKIKGMTVPNRIAMSPMVMYATDKEGPNKATPNLYHLIHYGSVVERGCSLIVAEAVAVTEDGRCSPEELALETDSQALGWKPVVDFVHSQGGKIGVQLSHGGRKSSTWALHTSKALTAIGKEAGGWADQPEKIISASAISYSEQDGYPVPREMTKEDIKNLVKKYKEARDRAIEIAGFDFVEIQAAHGYLVNCFLSAASNKRTDEYGGPLQNRMRFLLEIVDAVKDNEHPLFVRISAEEWSNNPDAWHMNDTLSLVEALDKHGVDLVDVSSGGIDSNQIKIAHSPGYHVPLARAVKHYVKEKSLKILVSTVGRINSAWLANDIITNQDADVVFIGSPFLKKPSLVWEWAEELNVKVAVSRPIGWPLGIV